MRVFSYGKSQLMTNLSIFTMNWTNFGLLKGTRREKLLLKLSEVLIYGIPEKDFLMDMT